MRNNWNRFLAFAIVALAVAITAGAAWAQGPWAITTTANPVGGGIVTPTNPTVLDGATPAFTMTPTANWGVSRLQATDQNSGALIDVTVGNSYTFPAVHRNSQLIATFSRTAWIVTPQIVGGGGTVAPNTPQTVNVGASTTFTLTPATGFQVWQYRISYNGGITWTPNWTDMPDRANDTHRDNQLAVAPTGDAIVQFQFQPLYTFTHNAYCHTDDSLTPIAGTLLPATTGTPTYLHGDSITLSFTANADYIFRYWADPSPGAPNYTILFTDSRASATHSYTFIIGHSGPAVAGTNMSVRGYYTRVEWLFASSVPNMGVGASVSPYTVDAYYDDPGATPNATRGAPNVPDRSTLNAVTNASGPVRLDFSREKWGTPGAVLLVNGTTWPNIAAPVNVGVAHFTGISVDRLGDNYRLTGRYSLQIGDGTAYRTIYSDNVIPPNPLLTENDARNNANRQRGGVSYSAPDWRNLNGCNYFNIETRAGEMVAFGYNLFGQLGIDTGLGDKAQRSADNVPRGFPGDYSADPWPHFTWGLVPEAGYWSGSIPAGEPGTVDAWFGRTWSYPLDTELQGKDHYEAVRVEQQIGTHQAVAAGQYHSLRLTSSGGVMAWGSNQYGQLGNGSNTDSTLPLQVTGIDNAIAIAAGMSHSLALIEDGTVLTWGRNNYGQLGDGTNTDRNRAVQVLDPGDPTGFLSDVIAIAAGDDHSLALKKDGALFAWGFNHDGELGNNSTSHSNVAVQVTEFTAARLLVGGKGHTGDILAVAFSAADTGAATVATASADMTARIWKWNQRIHPTNPAERPDTNLVTLVARLDDSANGGAHAHAGAVNGVVFSPDGKYAFTVSTDKTLKGWDAVSGAWLVDASDPAFVGTAYAGKAHQGSIAGLTACAVMANGRYYLVTSSVDRLIKVWEVNPAVAPSPTLVWTVRDSAIVDPLTGQNTAHAASVNAVAVPRQGGGTVFAIYSAGADSNGVLPVSTYYAKKWHYDTAWGGTPPATVVPDLVFAEHTQSITSVDVSPDGTRIVTGSYDKTAKIWDAAAGGAALATCASSDTDSQNGHRQVVNKAAFSPDNTYVITACDDKIVRRWFAATGTLDVKLYNHDAGASAAAFAPMVSVSIDKGTSSPADVRSGANVILTGGRDFIAKVIVLPRVVNMDGGGYHSIAADEAGDVWTWGLNVNGQLGNSTLVDRHYPGHVLDVTGAANLNLGAVADFLVPFLQVQAGNAHSLALMGDGSCVWSWGYNRFGECGNGTKNSGNLSFVTLPTQVLTGPGTALGSGNPIVGVSAGWGYSLAREADTASNSSIVWVWGHGHHGQLGNDDGEYKHWPPLDTESADQVYAVESTLYRQTNNKTDPPATTQSGHRWDRDNGLWGGNSPMTSISAGYWHSLGITVPQRYTLEWDVDPTQGGTVEKGDVQYSPTDVVYPPQTGVTNEAVWTWAGSSGAVTADDNTTIWVRAIPKPGYRFDHWAGHFAGTTAEQSCLMTRDYTVRAFFVREIRQYQLTINRIDESGNPLPQGGTVTGDGTYDENAEVVVTAVPKVGYDFVEWRGDPEITGSIRTTERVRMTGSKTIQAVFRVKQIKIYPKFVPQAGGNISWSLPYKSSGYDTGHDLDPNYFYVVYDYGTALQVQPQVNAGYRFLNWSGDIVGSDPTVWVDVDTTQDRRITANFKKIWTLNIIWSPGGQTFDTTPTQGSLPYDDGVVVNLSARDVTGFKFSQWTGQIPGSPVKSKTTSVIMDQDRTITAEYLGVNILETTQFPLNGGSTDVLPHPSPFDTNETVTVTATPAAGYMFLGWSGWSGGAWSGTTLTFQITQNESLTANFIAVSTRSGEVMSWGYNLYGGLGDGTQTTRREPVLVDPTNANHVKRLAAGAYHSLIVRANGTVAAWGYNSNGQVGDGTTTTRLTPVPVFGLGWPANRVRSAAAGDYHSVALRDDGFVFAWGQGLYGQLGNSQTGDVTNPSAISGLNNIVAIAAGAYHTLALRADGTVWSCGLNNRGQLGDGTQSNSFKIVQVVDSMGPGAPGFLQNVVAIAAGDNHSVALKSDGTVCAWGGNNWGQLGDGSTSDSAFPVQVMSGGQPLANVAAVACGSYHTLALVETAPVSGVRVGNVMGWGWNLFGQLADKGSLPQQYSAVPVLAQTASGTLDNIVIDPNGDTTIAAGYGYSMALRLVVGASPTKIPWMWGRNLVGELGNGAQTDSNVAVQISNLSEIRSLAAGKYHGLAVIVPVQHKITGSMTPATGGLSIVAAGLDGKGQVVAPVAPGSEPYFDENEHVSVTANPQPGYKFDTWSGDPVQPSGVLPNTGTLDMTADMSITANFQLDPLLYGLTVIISGSGHVNPDKQPDVNPNLYRSGTQVTLTALADPGFTFSGWTGDVVSLSPVVTVTMSTFRNVTATFISTASFRTITTQVTPIAGGSAIGGGTFALNSTTTLTATPNQGYRFYYWEVDGVTNINDNANPRTVLVDNNHTFAAHFVITSGNPGTLLGWGSNAYGQVGDGSTQDRLQPTAVLTLQNVTEFSAGQYHVLALQSNGSVYAWGDNTNGQLGFSGPPLFSPDPMVVTFAGLPANVQIKQVAAGGQFSVAVDTAGNVWTWGDNTYGQLGDNSVVPHSAPTQIAGIAGVEGVAAGENHVLALLSDGTVWAWGYNLRGQLGVGDGTDRWVPTQVVDPTDSTGFLTSVEEVAAGAMHSVALKTDGKVYAWGFNADGELGNGTTADNATPVQVLGGMPQVTGIGAGSYHSLAVDGSGNVWSWGYNAAGQLGDGTTVATGAGVPAKVKDSTDATGFLTGVVRVAGGYAHSAAIRSDSTVRAWGDNTWGQLGDLTRLSRTTPVQVMQAPGVPLTDVGAVAAGWTHTTAEVNPIYFRVVTTADTSDKGRIDGGGTFVQGATVTLTAVEYAGGQFQRWEVTPGVAGSLTSPTLSFTVDQNYSVIGHFVRNVANAYKLRVNLVPGLPASVIKVDPGATPGTDAQGAYYRYTFSPATVTVDNAAAGLLGYTFSRWQGPVVPTANPLVCNVLMQPQPAKDITIAAIFDLLCDLNVDARSDSGLPLPGTQIDSASYGGVTPYAKPKIQAGTTVDLTVNAASLRRVINGQTYDFAYWMVNGNQYPAGAARVTFQIAVQPTSAIAVYKALRSISVQSVGVTGVSITSTPSGYGGVTPYPPPVVNIYDGDGFTLTAPASWPAVNPTHNFSKWTLNGVDQSDVQTNLAVGPVSQDVSAVATYVLRRALTVQSSPVGGVAISSTTGQAGTTDATTLVYGAIADDQTLVNLSAPPSVTVANVVYDFVQWKWNGVLQPAGAWVLNQTITANSTAQALYKIRRVLTVQSTGNGSSMPGVVITSATGHGGTTAYSVNTFDQTAIKLTAPVKYANGSVDYNFQAWTVIGATTSISTTSTTASFIVSEDVTATAQYAIVQRTLNVWAGKDSATPLSVAMSAAPGSAAGTTSYSRQVGDEQTVVVTAPDTAVSGLNTYSFQRWAIGSTPQPVGQRDVSVTMNAGINLSAYYIPKLWNVSVQSTGDGQSMPGVAITGSRPGRTSYTAQQSDSTTLTLTATTPTTVNGTRYAFQVWNVGGVDQLPSNATYTTTLRSDVAAVAKYTVVTHPVAVQSDKLAGVPVTVNGASTVTTNTVLQAPDNAALTLVATQTGGTSGGTDYTFDHWTLNGVAQTKGQTTLVIPAVKVDTITAVAVYAVVQRALTVDSTPTGVTVTVNSGPHTTYYATTIPDNSALTLTAPQNATISGTSYVFNVWSINSVDQTAGVLTYNNGGVPIKADVAAVAKYNYVQRTVQVQSTGVTGVLINVTGGSASTVTTNGTVTANDNANVTFTAPATVLSGTVTYYFKRWVYDGVMQDYGKLDVTVSNIKVGHLVSATYGDDNVPPVVTLESPQAGSTEASLDSLIKVLVTDAKSGVDYKGVTITVNGAKVYDGAAETSPAAYDTTASALAIRGVCRRIAGPTANDWRFVFMPSVQYEYGQSLSVVVNAMDKQSVPVTATPAAFAAQARTFTTSVKANSDSTQLAHNHVAATVDASGAQYVIWDQMSSLGDTNLYLAYRPAGSTAFSAMRTVPESTPNSNDQSCPSIAWSAVNNRVYIAWQDNRYGQWDIFVSYSTPPAFSSWTTTRVTLGGVPHTRPAIGVDATGKVYLAWEEVIGGVRNIRVASSTNGTAFPIVATANSNADQSEPCLAVSTLDNSVYVLWTDARNVGASHSTDIYGFSSASWVAVPVANDPAGQTSPTVAIEPGTTMLHIAWAGMKTGNNDIFYASSAGMPGSPLAGVNVTQDAAAQILPSINVAGSGNDARIYLAWQDGRQPTIAGETDIYFADIRPGAVPAGTPPWVNVLVNTDATGASSQSWPKVIVDAIKQPVVFWSDSRNGGLDIYATAGTAVGANVASDTTAVDRTKATVRQVMGAPLGKDGVINGPTDVLIQIPANAMAQDAVVTIGALANPPKAPAGGFGVPYHFGPSGLQFTTPVTVYMPHAADACPLCAAWQVYYYDPLDFASSTMPWSQKGISNVQHVVISPALHAVKFQTTHFSTYATSGTGTTSTATTTGSSSGGSSSSGGGGGGGGCFIATAAYGEGGAGIAPENLDHLTTLRGFRRSVLMPTELGRKATSWYSAVSPAVAEQLEHSTAARQAVRQLFVNPLAQAVGGIVEEAR